MRTTSDVDGGVVNVAHCARIHPVQRVGRWHLVATFADGRQVDLAGDYDCLDAARRTIRLLLR